MNKLLPKLRNVVHDLQKIKKEKGVLAHNLELH
mgnify:CR=1 FL=1